MKFANLAVLDSDAFEAFLPADRYVIRRKPSLGTLPQVFYLV